jgi:hypothetical protein
MLLFHSLERNQVVLCCGDGVLDCGRERNIDVCAVDSAERVVRGAPVEVEAESWPVASECVIARETLRQELATEPASETASRPQRTLWLCADQTISWTGVQVTSLSRSFHHPR